MQWPRLERGDRTVQRVRLRLPTAAQPSRIRLALEEALRLATLPGEDQGRAFYFRRICLQKLPAAAPRSLWLDACQSELRRMADRAVHGRDHGAAAAEAVYFLSQQEALEWFLGGLLRTSAPGPWFAPMISGVAASESPAMQFVAAIERLRQLPSGWFAAATGLFAALSAGARALAPLLASIPPAVVSGWLRELGGTNPCGLFRASVSAERLSQLRDIIASSAFRPASAVYPRAAQPGQMQRDVEPWPLWLAALGIVAECPAELLRGSLMESARALVGRIAQSTALAPLPAGVAQQAPGSEGVVPGNGDHALESDAAPAHHADSFDEQTTSGLLPDPSLPTEAAGLYFLLNALERLGIESALEAAPQLSRFGFLPRLVLALAVEAGVGAADPALRWPRMELAALQPAIPDSAIKYLVTPDSAIPNVAVDLDHGRSTSVLAGSVPASAVLSGRCWPRIFKAPSDGVSIGADRLVRVWALAVRRWCWGHARLGLAEIVNRPGRILLTRADLDVTLPLSSVDLRIRRAGLDLDPGWAPWFGRVVRFHYDVPSPEARLPQAPRRGGTQ
jgi:hypothetical protein